MQDASPNFRKTTTSGRRSLRAAVYLRVSTPEQTLDGQEADLVAYCRARGWEPVVFRDMQSGATATRPGLEAMMQAVRARQVGAD